MGDRKREAIYYRKRSRGQQERLVFGKLNYFIRGTFQYLAKLFQSVHGDAFILAEIGDRIGAKAKFID